MVISELYYINKYTPKYNTADIYDYPSINLEEKTWVNYDSTIVNRSKGRQIYSKDIKALDVCVELYNMMFKCIDYYLYHSSCVLFEKDIYDDVIIKSDVNFNRRSNIKWLRFYIIGNDTLTITKVNNMLINFGLHNIAGLTDFFDNIHINFNGNIKDEEFLKEMEEKINNNFINNLKVLAS